MEDSFVAGGSQSNTAVASASDGGDIDIDQKSRCLFSIISMKSCNIARTSAGRGIPCGTFLVQLQYL